jgi:Protein of unknown function with HXXEE motif
MTGGQRYWPLLIPLTYLIHITEEWYGGFPAWASRYLGFQLTPAEFLQINIVAVAVILCVSLIALYKSLSWLMIPFAAAILMNGCAHAIASLLTWSYSPGVVSGLILWVPLGITVLRRMYPTVSHRLFWSAVALGFLLHLTVTLIAFEG